MTTFPKAYARFSGVSEVRDNLYSMSTYLNPHWQPLVHYPSAHFIQCPSHQARESLLLEQGRPAWHAPSHFGIPGSKT